MFWRTEAPHWLRELSRAVSRHKGIFVCKHEIALDTSTLTCQAEKFVRLQRFGVQKEQFSSMLMFWFCFEP